MVTPRITRRTALRGLSAVVALPWFESMAGWNPACHAEGIGLCQDGVSPLRLAFLYIPNGVHMPDWTPQQEGSDYTLTPILNKLAPFRSQFNVLSGLTLNGARALGDGPGDHARSVAAFLTACHPRKTDGQDISNGVSVDQLAAAHLGQQTRLPSLELGTEASSPAGRCDSGYSCAYASNMSWRTPTSPVAKETDPALVFDRLFSAEDRSATPAERAERNRRRGSILDYVREDARALHRQLSAKDRHKLDEYLYAVREVELRMQRAEKLHPDDSLLRDWTRPAGVPQAFEEHVRLLMDMMVLAFQTDSTRIASMMFANAGSNRSYAEIGVAEGHHELSHHGNNAEKQEKISRINQFHASMLHYFLQRLAAVPEREATLLDHVIIVYGSGISDGNRHNHNDLPILVAGGGGGRLTSGRHIRYPDETPLANLYLWLLQQIGLKQTSFADSSGPLAELVT